MRRLSVLTTVFVLLLVVMGAVWWSRFGPVRQGPKLAFDTDKPTTTLAEARKGFATKLTRRESKSDPLPTPPAELFSIVRYDSPAGKLPAYLSVDPGDGKKHPAMIWIAGGLQHDIGDIAWTEQSPGNDQSASAFRKAGLVMMYPAVRGTADGVGTREAFLGEVDDVLAAADFLAKQPFVDPNRIYLGGHSSGGTLVLLVAAVSDKRFRAVFSFGPVDDVSTIGAEAMPFDITDRREVEIRSPGRWLHSVKSPTYIFEGVKPPTSVDSLLQMTNDLDNPAVRAYTVAGADHFSILAPVTKVVAEKIMADDGSGEMSFDSRALGALFGPPPTRPTRR